MAVKYMSMPTILKVMNASPCGAVASGEIGVEDIDREVIRKSTTKKKLLRKDTE